MKKQSFVLLFGLCSLFVTACSAPTQQNNLANARFSDKPYYLTVCEFDKEKPMDVKGYTLYKLNLETNKSFTSDEIEAIVTTLFASDSRHPYTLTLAAEYDGTTMTEYYVDFLNENSSKIIKKEYNPLVVAGEAVPPYGLSNYPGDGYYDNKRLKNDFLIDENLIYPRGGLPNGVFYTTEAYAKSNNYKIQNIG